MSTRIVLLIFGSVFGVVTLGILLGVRKHTPFSENRLALYLVEKYAAEARAQAELSGEHGFRVEATPVLLAPAQTRGGPRYLVSVSPLVLPSNESKRIIIVCDTPFSDVPKRVIFQAPPSHAVGYSDGTTGLISPGEYARLNLSSFVSLGDLIHQKGEVP